MRQDNDVAKRRMEKAIVAVWSLTSERNAMIQDWHTPTQASSKPEVAMLNGFAERAWERFQPQDRTRSRAFFDFHEANVFDLHRKRFPPRGNLGPGFIEVAESCDLESMVRQPRRVFR